MSLGRSDTNKHELGVSRSPIADCCGRASTFPASRSTRYVPPVPVRFGDAFAFLFQLGLLRQKTFVCESNTGEPKIKIKAG